MWLAKVGYDRIEETIDPEQTIERALDTYLKKGYTREWINQRLQAIQVRKAEVYIRDWNMQFLLMRLLVHDQECQQSSIKN